jgi:hypothetical protein
LHLLNSLQGGFVMNVFKILLIVIFCFMIWTCSKTEEQSDKIKTAAESTYPDTVSADTVLNELEKNTSDLKKKTEVVQKEIDEFRKKTGTG